MKTIALTGATSPIGLILHDWFEKNFNVVPISRKTNFDLLTEEGYNNALKIIVDSDIFLNLANIQHIQTNLLLDVYNHWTKIGKNGRIINFGTLTTCVDIDLIKKLNVNMNMLANKLMLDKVHNDLCMKIPFDNQPTSTLIRFANYGKKTGSREGEPVTSDKQMIEIVDLVVNSTSYISTIDFRTTL
jgi:hypothetical protein